MADYSLKVVASAVAYSSFTVTNSANAYTNTDSTTYAATRCSNATTGFVKWSGFNFSALPDNAIIETITYKFKCGASSTSYVTNFTAYINNAAKAHGTHNTGAISVITMTVDASCTVADLKADSTKNYFYETCTTISGARNIYGMEITVDYDLPPSGNGMIIQELNKQIFGGV